MTRIPLCAPLPAASCRNRQRMAAFSFLLVLTVLSICYATMAGRLLLFSNQNYQQTAREQSFAKPSNADDGSSTAASAATSATVAAGSDSVERMRQEPDHFQNARARLEDILRYYPLEEAPAPLLEPQSSPKSKARVPLKATNASMTSSAPITSLLPPLDTLIDEKTWQIKETTAEDAKMHNSNHNNNNNTLIQKMLDFAVIGHAKTGTTFLQSTWFTAHPDIRMPLTDCTFMPKSPAQVVKAMYTLRQIEEQTQPARTDTSRRILYGYKNPQDIYRPQALVHIRDYFPRTRLIVGLRHPVWWFQSFYNHRIKRGGQLPPPETLVGPCRPESLDVCTDNANFHANLASLGLSRYDSHKDTTRTNRDNNNDDSSNYTHTMAREARYLELLATKAQLRRVLRPGLVNPIFLYEEAQLDAGRDAVVAEALRQDLSAFLGLPRSHPLPPLVDAYHAESAANVTHKFAICEPRYQALRQELLRIGQAAGTWIREFFLPVPTVTVSSRPALEALLERWGEDPCNDPLAAAAAAFSSSSLSDPSRD